jgi:hypothetical protein
VTRFVVPEPTGGICMDPRQFDSLVRRLGLAATRRGALGAILVGLVAPVLGEEAQADRKKGKGDPGRGRNNGKAGSRGKGRGQKKRGDGAARSEKRGGACRGEGHPCEGNQQCCEDLVCIVSGPGQAERCTPCGAAGQPCCDDDVCRGGATCDDGECVGCGTAGQPCCPGESCDDDSICDTSTGQCTACGGDGQPCCADDSCDGRRVCDGDGFCAPCGGDDQLCCEDGRCDEGFNCSDDGCEACGDVGLECCDEGDVCGEGQICTQGGECAACGGTDQPCCAEEECNNNFVCDVVANQCVPCGEDRQACCAGGTCGDGLSCDDDNVCTDGCGDQGEACCANGSCGDNLVCDEGTCEISCDIGDVICVIDGHGQCVPGVCCEEGVGPGCEGDLTCIAGGCINENQFRIVLRWGVEPRDLDSHLWLPLATPFHVAWDAKGSLAAVPHAELDIDDITGEGPETITIGDVKEGTYLYAVHHYAGTGTIGTSGATVEVYKGATLVASYDAPTEAEADWDEQTGLIPPYNDGTIWWTVFQLDYDGVNPAVITGIDAASTDPAPYPTDNPFSRSAGAEKPLKSSVSGGNTAPRRSRMRKHRRRARR